MKKMGKPKRKKGETKRTANKRLGRGRARTTRAVVQNPTQAPACPAPAPAQVENIPNEEVI